MTNESVKQSNAKKTMWSLCC